MSQARQNAAVHRLVCLASTTSRILSCMTERTRRNLKMVTRCRPDQMADALPIYERMENEIVNEVGFRIIRTNHGAEYDRRKTG